MFTFGIIYLIVLFGFSQAFYFLYKGHPQVDSTLFATYPSTWMALFQTTLGDYSVSNLNLMKKIEEMILQTKKWIYFFEVFRLEQHNLSEFGKNGVCDFHDFRADSTVEHVDCYDG